MYMYIKVQCIIIIDKSLEDNIDHEILLDLSRKDMLIMSRNLRLLNCVGQGKVDTWWCWWLHTCMYVGEFGLVYKAHLLNKDGVPEDVAVKTLKGISALA